MIRRVINYLVTTWFVPLPLLLLVVECQLHLLLQSQMRLLWHSLVCWATIVRSLVHRRRRPPRVPVPILIVHVLQEFMFKLLIMTVVHPPLVLIGLLMILQVDRRLMVLVVPMTMGLV